MRCPQSTLYRCDLYHAVCKCRWSRVPTDEDNCGREICGHLEQLSNQLWPVPEVLLDQLTPNHTQEGGRGAVGHSLGKKRLACARLTIQDDTLGGGAEIPCHPTMQLG